MFFVSVMFVTGPGY